MSQFAVLPLQSLDPLALIRRRARRRSGLVLRVNSTLNASTHQARNNEAIAIAIANAIAGEFTRTGGRYSSIQSFSVEYVVRTGTPAHDSIIDLIDVRKNAAGKFELHIT